MMSNPTQQSEPYSKRRLFAAAAQIVLSYGRARLLMTMALILCQAVAQVMGVASIFWFISVAVAPDGIRSNAVIAWILKATSSEQMPTHSLTLACGLASLFVLVVANVLSLTGEYARARYAHDLGCWLRDLLLRKILNNPYQYFLRTDTSVLVKKVVQDVMQFIMQIVMPALEIITRVLIFLMLSCWLITQHPAIATGGLALFAVFELAFIRAVRLKASRISDGVKSGTRRTYSAVGQIFAGIKPVITENGREYFAETHHKPSQELSRLLPQATLVGSLARYVLETLVYGGLVAWMLLELLSGTPIEQLMPSVGLFAVAAYRMLPCIQITASQLTVIQSTAYSLQEILDEFRGDLDCSRTTFTADASATPLAFQQGIQFDRICFKYAQTDRLALDCITMTIPKGKRVGIVGRTGSGKSTIVNLLLGLFHPSSGSILIDDQQLTKSVASEWRAAIGYVPQDPFLIDATIAENIAFGVPREAIDDAHAFAVIEIAQLADFIREECSDGLDTLIGERGVRLSGGQRQRIAIARALYKRPSVLILDEATSALDNVTEKLVARGLASLGQNLTVISIAHRLSTIEDCDCIFYLSDGRVTSSGSYPELIRNSVKFKQLVDAG